MSIFPRHFEEPIANCTDIIPMPLLPESPDFPAGGGSLVLEEEKSLVLELALSSMDELLKMARTLEPLWMRSDDAGKEVLNVEEHERMFPWPINLKQNCNEFRTEASRDRAVVILNSITLVDAFMDAVSP